MPEPFTLEGGFVRLEPLNEAHIPDLVEAAAEDRSHFQWTYTPDGTEQMTGYVRDALAKVASGAHVAFATVRKGAERAAATGSWGPPGSARSSPGSGRRGPAISATAYPTWSTSGSPGWPVRPSARR